MIIYILLIYKCNIFPPIPQHVPFQKTRIHDYPSLPCRGWLGWLRFMASIKKLLDEHVAAGDIKPAAITNGTSGPSFAPKPRGFMATEDDNGFDVNQDFTKAG